MKKNLFLQKLGISFMVVGGVCGISSFLSNASLLGFEPSKLEKSSELLSKGLLPSPVEIRERGKHVSKAPKLNAASKSGTVMWGNVISASDWTDTGKRGIYSFLPTSPYGIATITDETLLFGYGSGMVDGILYGMCLNADYSATLHSIDTKTWTELPSKLVEDLSLIAISTAEYNSTQTIYGEFYNSNMSGYELGIIDYTVPSRTTIGVLVRPYVAMGITSEGILYGIGSDSNLYKIDTETADESYVGATGLSVAKEDGQYYLQSGVIDQKDNTFYWAAVDKDLNMGMYKVNLTDGSASLVSDCDAIILSLTIPVASPVKDAAPAEVTNVATQFDNGSLSGTISFDLPLTTHNQSALTGELTYVINANGISIATGEGEAGTSVTVPVSIEKGGEQLISIVCSNEEGEGDMSNLAVWVGYDYPLSVKSATLVIDSEGMANVSWKAPAAGQHGGYIGELSYSLYRYTNGKKLKVADDISELSFKEAMPTESLSVYRYGIIANNNGMKSIETQSNEFTYGESIIPDYLEDFLTLSNFDLYTIEDKNNDGNSWQYDSEYHCAVYNSSVAQNGDDWMFTPAVEMSAQRDYTFVIRANMTGVNTEKFEVCMGTTPTSTMSDIVIPETQLMGINVQKGTYRTFSSDKIRVTKDGNYYFGVHALSDAYSNQLRVDSIFIEAGPLSTAPGAVRNLSIKPDSKGELKTIVKFEAPYSTVSGELLTTAIQKIDVKRNGDIIQVFTDVSAGDKFEFEDTTVDNGWNNYEIICWADDEYGQKATISVWGGIDIPCALSDVNAVAEEGNVRLSWNEVADEGIHGGAVIPSEITYNIYDASIIYGVGQRENLIGTSKETSFIVDFDAENCDPQQKYWIVSALNKAGESDNYLVRMVVGEAIALPFEEHFLNGQREQFWYTEPAFDYNMAIFGAQDSSDGDGYCMEFDSYATDGRNTTEFISGKISLTGSINPYLIFDKKSNSRISNLKVIAFTSKDRVEIEEQALSEDWSVGKVSLVDFKDEKWIQIGFQIEFEPMDGTTWEYGQMFLDNIRVIDLYQRNLCVDISAPEEVYAGLTTEPVNVDIIVKNNGEENIGEYKVTLIADGVDIWTEDGKLINSFEQNKLTALYSPASSREEGHVKLMARVDIEDDNIGDNEASTEIYVIESDGRQPENVNIQEEREIITVSWAAPLTEPDNITEDFESYDAWAIDNIGSWTTVDVDGGIVQGLFQGLANPVENTTYAYTVFAPYDYTGDGSGKDMTATYPNLAPHSGNHYLASSYAVEGWNRAQQDNWLISPLLPGCEQIIKFWVNNNVIDEVVYAETFQILYSDSNKELDNFKFIDEIVVNTGTWTEVSVLLPQGTKYFAIRQVSGPWDTYLFMIDDVCYMYGGGDVVGYNIYIDGQYAATTDSLIYEMPSATINDGQTIGVSAIYANGLESKPVNVMYKPTGIDSSNVINPTSPVDIYSIDGVLIRHNAIDTDGLYPGVYIVGNRKIVIK